MSDCKCYLSLVVAQHSICTTAHSYVLCIGICVDTFKGCMPSYSIRDAGVPTSLFPNPSTFSYVGFMSAGGRIH